MGCYEHGNKVSSDVKGWEFVGYRNEFQLQMVPVDAVS